MAIYVDFEKPRTVRQFIKRLFSYQVGGYLCTPVTFRDPECTQPQCRRGAYRSFDDVLECVKTYYPSVTAKKLMHILVTTKIENPTGTYYMRTFSCSGIRRINFFFSRGPENFVSGSKRPKYNSKHSWGELYDKIGIKSQAQLDKLRATSK